MTFSLERLCGGKTRRLCTAPRQNDTTLGPMFPDPKRKEANGKVENEKDGEIAYCRDG